MKTRETVVYRYSKVLYIICILRAFVCLATIIKIKPSRYSKINNF